MLGRAEEFFLFFVLMDAIVDGDEIKCCVTCKFCPSVILSAGNAVYKELPDAVS